MDNTIRDSSVCGHVKNWSPGTDNPDSALVGYDVRGKAINRTHAARSLFCRPDWGELLPSASRVEIHPEATPDGYRRFLPCPLG